MFTRADVDAIGQLHSDRSPIISLILRVDKERIDEDYTIRLKNLLRRAADSLDSRYDHDQTEAVLADLDRIGAFFRDEGSQFGQGVALYASSPAGIWQVIEIPREIESEISVGFEPYVAPLINVLERFTPFCTCLVSRNQGRIFYGQLGTFEELSQIVDTDVPGQHDQGGWSQARYDRHIEEHVRGHLKRVADDLFRLFQERPFRWLVLGGSADVIPTFIELLHPYLRERHIGTVRTLMEAAINDVHRESRDTIERWATEEKSRAIDMVRNEALRGDRGVSGIDNTIMALQQGQILTLVVDDTLAAPGAVCRNCRAVQPTTDATPRPCVFCEGPTELLDNVVSEIVTGAFRQSAGIVYLDTPELRDRLSDLGRIGALLRFHVASQSEPSQTTG
ncbi:MAG TPA: Vms1/Ankzf1 family peptidyl-tRNA hydrolase [Thermomicrobiaceae bacterium]|nr:Vms1/Ankzf1 family peptidyl-tRNA hydrolase [Thermomicrobiaceae bacterium]